MVWYSDKFRPPLDLNTIRDKRLLGLKNSQTSKPYVRMRRYNFRNYALGALFMIRVIIYVEELEEFSIQ